MKHGENLFYNTLWDPCNYFSIIISVSLRSIKLKLMSCRLLFFLLLSILYLGCSRMTVDATESKTYSYLALGDSYTIGEGVDETLRWPVQLSRKLSEENITVSPVDIIATTGWTTRDLITAITEKKPQHYDLVSLLIGVNNQYQGLPFSTFTKELDELLQTAIQLAGEDKKVFVVSIPDYGVTPFGKPNQSKIATELNQYNDYTKQVCRSLDIPHIDITEISRNLENEDGSLAPDKLHPSGSQYGSWAEEILPVVKSLLRK